MIIVDRKLEEFMQIVPPRDGTEYNHSGDDMKSKDQRFPLPFNRRPTLVHGCIELVRMDDRLNRRDASDSSESFDGDLNRLLGTDSEEWHVYYPLNDRMGFGTVEYGLFVYWCLAKGCTSVVVDLPWGNIPLFGPESPVARIDVSHKRQGSMPSRNDMICNVLYLFQDGENTAGSHNLRILDRLGTDMVSKDNPWATPERLTLGELTDICGNSIMFTTIYEVADQNGSRKTDERIEPIELVTDLPEYWNYRGTWNGPLRTCGKSIYSKCRVEKYMIYGDRESIQFLEQEGYGGLVYGNGGIGLCAVIDSKET